MSIKHGLLALLERGPMYGYQLRAAFEESTGGTWPLNIGQVYTTLGRLERDDSCARCRSTTGGSGRTRSPTPAAPSSRMWFATPVSHADRPRDELAIKLALARHHARRRRTRGAAEPAHRDDADAAGVHPAEGRPPTKPADLPWRLVHRRDAVPGRGRDALAGPLRDARWSGTRPHPSTPPRPPADAATTDQALGRRPDRVDAADEHAVNCVGRAPHPRQRARPPYTRCAAST